MTTGAKTWRVRFQIDGKDARKTLGNYPAIGLTEARRLRDEFKLTLDRGEDPRKPAAPIATFGSIAQEWLTRRVEGVKSAGHVRTIYLRMNKYILPAFGERPIKEITPPEILTILRKIEGEGYGSTLQYRTVSEGSRLKPGGNLTYVRESTEI